MRQLPIGMQTFKDLIDAGYIYNAYPIQEFDNIIANKIELDKFEVFKIPLKTILFQAGYLTIKSYDPVLKHFTLNYPNQEVRESFLTFVMEELTAVAGSTFETYVALLKKALNKGSLPECIALIQKFLIHIPNHLYIRHEKCYQGIFYIIFKMAGFDIITVPRYTSQSSALGMIGFPDGYIDASIETENTFYVFELKLDKTSEQAMQQIKDRKYYEKFLDRGKPVILVAINFQTETHQISPDWMSETMN